jgi:hypothetical protein
MSVNRFANIMYFCVKILSFVTLNKMEQGQNRYPRFYPYWKNCRYNYFLWQTVNGPIDMRVWKGRRLENILKLDSDLR